MRGALVNLSLQVPWEVTVSYLATVSVGMGTLETVVVSPLLICVPWCHASLSLGDHVCLNQTCSGNGTCRANDTSPFYSCDCEDGYLGDDCQFMEELVSCDLQCQNGDDCVVSIGMCPAGSVEDHMHQLSLLKFLVMF